MGRRGGRRGSLSKGAVAGSMELVEWCRGFGAVTFLDGAGKRVVIGPPGAVFRTARRDHPNFRDAADCDFARLALGLEWLEGVGRGERPALVFARAAARRPAPDETLRQQWPAHLQTRRAAAGAAVRAAWGAGKVLCVPTTTDVDGAWHPADAARAVVVWCAGGGGGGGGCGCALCCGAPAVRAPYAGAGAAAAAGGAAAAAMCSSALLATTGVPRVLELCAGLGGLAQAVHRAAAAGAGAAAAAGPPRPRHGGLSTVVTVDSAPETLPLVHAAWGTPRPAAAAELQHLC